MIRSGIGIGLILSLVYVSSGCGSDPYVHPRSDVDVQSYQLDLRLDPQTLHIQALARITALHSDSLSTLAFQLGRLRVDSVRVEQEAALFQHSRGQLQVALEGRTSLSVVDIYYQGVPEEGIYAERIQNQTIVYTDSWPDRTQGWMPVVDHPSDPARFELKLSVPEGYEVVANGRITGVDTLEGRVVSQWRMDSAAPTYSFAFAAGRFSTTEQVLGDTLLVRYYLLPQDASKVSWLDRTPQVLAFFAERIGPYPFASFTAVQAPILNAGMENASMPFLRADLFRTRKDVVESVLVHEIVHQWFGNRMVLGDWRDFWLSEGIATYLTTLFYEHADGLEVARTAWIDMTTISLPLRRSHQPLVLSGPVDPDQLLTWVPYQKGAAVMHLLRLKLGDDAFFQALRTLYRTGQTQPVTTRIAQDVFETVSGQNLETVFDFWVYGNQLPRLITSWNGVSRTLKWHIEDDAGTLSGVPVELRLQQGRKIQDASILEREVILTDWSGDRPTVNAVGILMKIDTGS